MRRPPLPGHLYLLSELALEGSRGFQALERLAGILESEGGSITLMERGDLETIPRAPGFRLFAAMNPATDAGANPCKAIVCCVLGNTKPCWLHCCNP